MPPPPITPPEQFISIKECAEQLGLRYFKLQRAVRANLVPSYTLLNSRKLVRLSEVVVAIESSGNREASD
jgi:hypothetical protein